SVQQRIRYAQVAFAGYEADVWFVRPVIVAAAGHDHTARRGHRCVPLAILWTVPAVDRLNTVQSKRRQLVKNRVGLFLRLALELIWMSQYCSPAGLVNEVYCVLRHEPGLFNVCSGAFGEIPVERVLNALHVSLLEQESREVWTPDYLSTGNLLDFAVVNFNA